MIKNLSVYNRAVAELIFAGAIWGMSFTCVRWALVDFSATSIIFWRFFLAFVFGEALVIIFNRKNLTASLEDIKTSFWAGLFLGLTLLLQTIGLKYTTATNSSFITSLYVVFIPIITGVFFKHKIHLHHIAISLLALIGMSFLLDLYHQDNLNLNYGDLLTLICAVFSSLQIINVGLASKKVQNAFRFNNYQTFWSLVSLSPYIIYKTYTEKLPIIPEIIHFKSILGIILLSMFASVLAFYLQVRAQKVLGTTTSSLLFLLEAPYAFFFAMLFLNETLNLLQVLGLLIILTSSALSIYLDRPKN